ncbi:MAG: RMD1 family protein [Nitrospirota bacterium]|jgi:uncharacterized Rmd1/YagE family protein
MENLSAVAWSLGNRLTARALEGWAPPVAKAPLTLPGPGGGFAVLFRFGAVAAVGLDPAAAERLVEQARELTVEPHGPVISEEVTLTVGPGFDEGLDTDDRLRLRELDVGRAQVVASILAKSVVLDDYEGSVGSVFERIEPFAVELRSGRLAKGARALLRELGDVVLIESRMVGRAEVGEKPEITWDAPELDRLYEKLAKEYELRDREQALARKLDLISRAASTYLGLLSDRRTLRVEWYIVILILVEIVLFVYELFGAG